MAETTGTIGPIGQPIGDVVKALKAACEAFGVKTQDLADMAIGAAIKAQLNREDVEKPQSST